MAAVGFGVVGVGTWGERHAATYAYRPEVELTLVCDLNEQRAREIAVQYGAQGWTTDYREVVEREDIQAVSVVTPDFAHREIAVAAAQAGKHVLCEKPLATTLEDCEAIIEAARQAGVKLMVDFHNRFNPPFLKMKRALEEGELGEPLMFYVRLNDTIFVPTQMLSWGGQSTVGWFLGSHAFDLIRWLSGAEVRRVYAVSRSVVLKQRGLDTPDFFQTTLELTNGATAQVENCWVVAETAPVVFDFKCELVATKGTMYADPSHHRMVQKYTPEEATYPDVIVFPEVYGKPTGFAIESINHFVDCVLHDREPLITGEDGLQATKIVLAMEESARTGQPVEVG
ncbi:MAG TPA: Gfo/Idh/MocA family oxidoreductase [Armatimonadetes bacterium]|nr:Gfo/Idh/MocA family oxidoreductase [Armatimonadota bacterium]